MRVLVAMSGGVDSSVAALLLKDAGHDVVGATMKLWGGESDSGCCSVSDVEDARRVAAQIGIAHHVFNFSDDFHARVVDTYVDAHARLRTPNPCIECNRHIKFERFLDRALRLGFDAMATGHHARVEARARASGHGASGTTWVLRRGVDTLKDQSYVLSMLGQRHLAALTLPVGEMTKAQVRRRAQLAGLRTASKPDSQDVCFITAATGREGFLGSRMAMTPGHLVDESSGEVLGTVPALELVTVGQRRGISPGASGRRRYALGVDRTTSTVHVGDLGALMCTSVAVEGVTWVDQPVGYGTAVAVQASAHGTPFGARFTGGSLDFDEPQRRIAPGQTVAMYAGDVVVGSGIAAPEHRAAPGPSSPAGGMAAGPDPEEAHA